MTVAFSAFVALVAAIVARCSCALLYHVPRASMSLELRHLALCLDRDGRDRPVRVADLSPHRRRLRAHASRTRCRAGGISTLMIRSGMSSGSHGPALPELHKRLRWVALVGIAAFALLVGRLWQLQVMRGEGYYERTVSNVIKAKRYLPSVRGQTSRSQGRAATCGEPPGVQHLRDAEDAGTPEVKAELERMLGLSDDEIAKLDVQSGSRSASASDPEEPGARARRSGPRSRGDRRAGTREPAGRRGPPRAVSLLSAGRARGVARRLHDADDRRGVRSPRRAGLRDQRARRSRWGSRPRGRTTCAARRASSASRSMHAASGSTTRPPPR